MKRPFGRISNPTQLFVLARDQSHPNENLFAMVLRISLALSVTGKPHRAPLLPLIGIFQIFQISGLGKSVVPIDGQARSSDYKSLPNFLTHGAPVRVREPR